VKVWGVRKGIVVRGTLYGMRGNAGVV